MPVIQVQDEFQSGDNVTASSLNDLVNDASFVSGAVDNSTLQVATAGHLKVKDNGILSNHLKSDATNDSVRAVTTNHIRNDAVTNAKIADGAVDTAQIAADAVEFSKMQNMGARTVIGNNTDNDDQNPTAISIDDLRGSISNATAHTTDSDSNGINDLGGDDGLMSAEDKTKLDGVEAGATGDQTGAEMKTAIGNATAHTSDTDSDGVSDSGGTNGLMSANDKTKLDGIEAGATGDQTGAEMKTAIGNATAHTTDTDSDGVSDSGGTNGLMSANDKTKLDGIAAGAEVNVQSDWNATSGDALILNKPSIAYTSAISNATAHTTDSDSDGINDTGGDDGLMSAEDKTKLDGVEAGANTGTVTSITAGGNLTGNEITTSGTISNLDSNNIGLIGSGITANTTDTFDGGTTYKAQIKDGLRVYNATGVAKLKLITDKTGGGGASITLKSTTPPAPNEGDYSIFIGGANGKFNIRNEQADKNILMDATGDWHALSNTQDLGKTGNRWDDVWSNGSFNGSDRNIKQDIQDLDEAEKRVAVKCKSLIKKYRMKDAVTKKGNDARIHVGIIAQELQAAFESEGLDAFRYSMIGKDIWWEATDAEGNRDVKYEATVGYTEVTQMSVRYNELLAFIISAM